MTHEYTLLVGGTVLPGGGEPDVSAIAWAGGTILALGTDHDVRTLSRGDSRVVDLRGAAVVPLAPDAGVAWPVDARLEVGGPADLAVLDRDPRTVPDSTGSDAPVRVRALVRGGRVLSGSLAGE